MEQCPNCGSSVRSGAKFCTICGFRLTNGESAAPVTEVIAPGDADSAVAAMLDPRDSSAAPAEPAAIATWPSSRSPASDDAVGGEPTGAEATAEPNEPETDAPSFADWPVSTWGSPPAEPPEPPESPESPEPLDPVAEAAESSLAAPATDDPLAEPPLETETAAADAPVTDAPVTDAPATDASDPGDSAPAPADEFAWWAAPTTDAPAVADEPSWFTREQATVAPAAESRSMSARSDAGVGENDHDQDLERANDLLDELRGIVTTLATRPAGGTAAVDLDAVVSELTAARDDAGGSADAFAALRTALAETRARPRDIDAVLALAGHADTIAALQDAYERHAMAVDRALAGLQAEE